ncbi:hypothetical protein [Agrobacterium sp. Azo12]|uniref:hypothetical protein n=1 Tax=Agrobacterium sp. Azo12 TaxID=3031129 RepID=UPI0023D887B6|nr:hypothetical protein [Agrobacterium sp. Azo12]MDO5897865.1 hypothetical protein [Agrobacterium sp. Azo12]
MTEDEHFSPSDGTNGNITGEEITIPSEGDLRHFFELLLEKGELTINDNGDHYTVQVSQRRISGDARRFLAGGGPAS